MKCNLTKQYAGLRIQFRVNSPDRNDSATRGWWSRGSACRSQNEWKTEGKNAANVFSPDRGAEGQAPCALPAAGKRWGWDSEKRFARSRGRSDWAPPPVASETALKANRESLPLAGCGVRRAEYTRRNRVALTNARFPLPARNRSNRGWLAGSQRGDMAGNLAGSISLSVASS